MAEVGQMFRSLDVVPTNKGSCWFNFERRNWTAAIFVAGLIGFSAGNGHTTQDAITHVSDQLGQAKQAAGCEHWRAKVATGVAKQAIDSANALDAQAPSKDSLPQDNCPKLKH